MLDVYWNTRNEAWTVSITDTDGGFLFPNLTEDEAVTMAFLHMKYMATASQAAMDATAREFEATRIRAIEEDSGGTFVGYADEDETIGLVIHRGPFPDDE